MNDLDDSFSDLDKDDFLKWCGKQEDRECALFMDPDLPLDLNNESVRGLQHIIYDDDDTPDQIAEDCRTLGNEYLNAGKAKYNDAVQSYTRGIDAKSSNQKLNSILYSNRARAYYLLGNYTSCLCDSRKAIHAQPSYPKPYYWAVNACRKLALYKDAKEFCDKAMLLTNEQKIFQDFIKELDPYLVKLDQSANRDEENKIEKEKLRDKFFEILEKRDITLKQSKYHDIVPLELNYFIDETGSLHWQILLLYDEVGICDLIEDVNENTAIKNELMVLFPKETDNRISQEGLNVELPYVYWKLGIYYECGYPDNKIFLVHQEMTLKYIISKIKYVEGLPIFHILVRGSKAEKDFLSRFNVSKLETF